MLPLFASSQVYIGNSMGLSYNKYSYYDYDEHAVEWEKQAYIFYSMPIGYQTKKNWLLESGWLYNGKVVIPFTFGKKVAINKKFSCDLLAGFSDVIDMPLKMKIVSTAQVRLNRGPIYFHMNVYPDGGLVGLGVKGFILQHKKTKK
jgi:hypothetical protein